MGGISSRGSIRRRRRRGEGAPLLHCTYPVLAYFVGVVSAFSLYLFAVLSLKCELVWMHIVWLLCLACRCRIRSQVELGVSEWKTRLAGYTSRMRRSFSCGYP